MRLELIITMMPDGTTAVAIDNQAGLDFEQGKGVLEEFLARAGLAGVPLTITGEVERHTHDAPAPAVHTHTSGYTYSH